MYWGSIGQGFFNGLDQAQQQQQRDQQMQYQRMLMAQAAQNQAAQQRQIQARTALGGMMLPPPPGAGGQMPQPTVMPGQSSQQLQPPPQQNPGQPGVQQGAPGSPSGPGVLPPYRDPMQQPPAGAAAQGGGAQPMQLPPPPAKQDPVQAVMPSVPEMVKRMQAQGIPQDQWVDVLDAYKPFYDDQNKQQLAELTLQLNASKAAETAFRDAVLLGIRGRDSDTRAAGETRRGAQGDRRLDQRDEEIGLKQQLADTAKSKEGRLRNAASTGAALSSEDTQFWADYVRQGGSLPAGLGRGAQGGKTVQAIMHQVATGAGAGAESAIDMLDNKNAQTGAASAARTAGTASARMAIAATEALGSFDLAEQASAKVPRGSFKGLNSALLSYEKGTGSPEAGSFEAAVNTAVNTYAKAINPSGTATVSDKEHAREILSTADGPAAFKARMAVLRQEVERARKAPQQVAQDLRKGGKKEGGKVVNFSELP